MHDVEQEHAEEEELARRGKIAHGRRERGGARGRGARGRRRGAADPQDSTEVFPTVILQGLRVLIGARTSSLGEETVSSFFYLLSSITLVPHQIFA
jgi:hypothetical protein